MKKEITFVIALCMFAFAYVLDFIAGKVNVVVSDPFMFLTNPILTKFPLTAAGVFIRTIAIFLTVLVIYSVINKRYFTKAFVSLAIVIFSEAYAIQQFTTGNRTTPIQWTLSIAYAGGLMILLFVFYILKGIFHGFTKALGGEEKEDYPEPLLSEENQDEEEQE
jgi:hypothetical protein